MGATVHLSSAHDDHLGGVLRLHTCKHKKKDCQALQGERLRKAYEKGRLNHTALETVLEVPSRPRQAVFFLSENVHSVTRILQSRDVVFVWMSCFWFGSE